MAIDPYAPCPCGSGKKLKFCCADLAGDVEKVSKLVASDQPHAALKHVDQLLAKQPDRASLLDLQAMLQLSLGDYDAAEKAIAHFLAVAPESAIAHAERAMLAASRGQDAEAAAYLQDALERTDDAMPQRVFEAIGAVGHALLVAGDVVAARAHLLLYSGVAPDGDDRAIELLLRLNLQGGLPLLLRDNLQLADPAPQSPQKAAIDQANRLAHRGRWRRAEDEYAKLLDANHPQPAVVYNLALVRGWLGDESGFAAGLHRFARLDVPLDDAVDAEALAQLVDPALEDPTIAAVRVTYPLLDEDAAAERLAMDKRIERYEFDPETLDEAEATRPRSTHMLLDRPVPASGAELTIDQAPNVLALLSVYGKRTDRSARLEATTDRNELFEISKRLIAEILGDAIGPEEESEVVSEKSASDEALSWRWRLPDDTPPAHRRELLMARRRRAILDDWTAAPRAALDGLSPRDAASRAELRIPLLASVLIIEQSVVDSTDSQLFKELREQLGLPAAELIDVTQDARKHVPTARLMRVDVAKASTERLLQLFNQASLSGANAAMLRIAQEVVSRSDAGADIAPVYRQLIRSEPDPDRALQWIARARQWAASANQPAGEWALLELEVHIERGDAMGVQHALDDIRTNYLKEPGVADATYRLLYTAGLLAPREEQMAALSGLDEREPAAAAGRLWTPGQDAPTPAGGKKSAIWTP